MRAVLEVALLVGLAATAAAEENPFKKSEVGDWVEYKLTSNGDAQGTTKMTIVAKKDTEVTYTVAQKTTSKGKGTPPVKKVQVDLSKPYDPMLIENLDKRDSKVTKAGEGAETIKVGGKEYETKWIKMKVTTEVKDITIDTEYKLWFSKDVPLFGMVKMETSSTGLKTTMELNGSGHK